MAEIKTCEHYVLSRLMEEEDKNAYLEEKVTKLTSELVHLQEDMNMLCNTIKKYSRLRENTRDDGSTYQYISFDGIWEYYEPADFAVVTSIVGYKKEEEVIDGTSISD